MSTTNTINMYVTPEMYGAVGDGITDDTIAIQTAANTGKVVHLFNTYLISNTINVVSEIVLEQTCEVCVASNVAAFSINQNYQRISGSGKISVAIHNYSSSVIRVEGGCRYISIEGITILGKRLVTQSGNWAMSGSPEGTGIEFATTDINGVAKDAICFSNIVNCNILHFGKGILFNCDGNYITNCGIKNANVSYCLTGVTLRSEANDCAGNYISIYGQCGRILEHEINLSAYEGCALKELGTRCACNHYDLRIFDTTGQGSTYKNNEILAVIRGSDHTIHTMAGVHKRFIKDYGYDNIYLKSKPILIPMQESFFLNCDNVAKYEEFSPKFDENGDPVLDENGDQVIETSEVGVDAPLNKIIRRRKLFTYPKDIGTTQLQYEARTPETGASIAFDINALVPNQVLNIDRLSFCVTRPPKQSFIEITNSGGTTTAELLPPLKKGLNYYHLYDFMSGTKYGNPSKIKFIFKGVTPTSQNDTSTRVAINSLTALETAGRRLIDLIENADA